MTRITKKEADRMARQLCVLCAPTPEAAKELLKYWRQVKREKWGR